MVPLFLGWERTLPARAAWRCVCLQLEGSAKRSSLIQSWLSAVAEQGAGCLLWVRDNLGSTYYISAPVSIIPFPAQSSQTTIYFFQKQRGYITQWAKSQISLLFYESCDVTRKHVGTKWVSQPSPAVMFLFAVQLDWNLGALSSRWRVEVSRKLLPHSTGHQLMEKHLCKVVSSMLLPACLLLPTSSKLKWAVYAFWIAFHCE